MVNESSGAGRGDMMRNSGFAERRTISGVFGGLIGLLAMSSAAGLLMAAAVTPVMALSSIAATDTINVFENLPEFLSIDRLSQKSNIYATRSDGTTALLASFHDQNRIEVGLDEISPYVKDAAIASEDPRFYEHGGVDLQGPSGRP
jgi:membrane peptidoglycan carboxypeptidase